jgi:F-type H+-transporting ATPase subunit gamma
MPSIKAIKRRLVSVKNTQQIMKAMNLVAASKLQKNRTKLDTVRPLFDESSGFFTHGVPRDEVEDSVYYQNRGVKNAAYVIISGERGLCGSYNANILKEAFTFVTDKAENGINERIVSVGAKTKEYFARRRKNIVYEYPGVMENITYEVAQDIALQLDNMFTSTNEAEKVEEIYVAYTKFGSLLSHNPTITKLLPFSEEANGDLMDVIYEPNVGTYLKKSVPVYLSMFIYGAMIESAVCEQAARMTSMDAAARNAGEILEDLTLELNRRRQGAITQEISEIVGGANAI